MNALMISLKSQDGNSVAVDGLAAAIQAWSRKHQEMEEQTLNFGTVCFGLKRKSKNELCIGIN